MALQRSPTNDASCDERTAPPKGKGIREWLRSVASPELSSTANPDGGTTYGAPHGSTNGSTNGSTYGQPAVGPYVKPHGELHGPSNDAEQDALFRRVGDSVLLKGSAISPPACPLQQALALLTFLQEQPGFEGAWVGARDLENCIYPIFLRASGRPPVPWRTVTRALGRITRKRIREFAYQGGGYKCVTQYLIPDPGRRLGPRARARHGR